MLPLKINDQEVNIPTDLSEITLSQFLTYYDEHGREIDKKIAAVLKETYADEFDRDIDLMVIETEEAIAWYSFFTGFDFSTVIKQDSNDLLSHFRNIKRELRMSETENYQIGKDIVWEGAVWMIRDWKVTPASKYTFNELLTSKEATRQIHSIGKGNWDSLIYLCAVFFRKVKEPFTDEMVMEGSERLELMKKLPMSYAIQVGFFLSYSVMALATASQSLKDQAVTQT